MKADKKSGRDIAAQDADPALSALIDAAERCYARLGVRAATMADIAEEAGISRRTLYRSFSSHEDILGAVMRRAIQRFWDQFNATHGHLDDFCDILVEALIYTIKFAPKTKTHRVLFDPSMILLVNDFYINNAEYVREQAIAMNAVYQRTRHSPGTKQDLDMVMVCEWFNRLAVSFLVTSSSFFHSEQKLRALLATMFEPALRDTNPANRKPVKKLAEALKK
jgi:AcrR family transcriptional regulator